ncbi:MAG: helix-turn-helix domain-containing protein [Nanoarchaeota archaeon]|nr:helix-turn-helix domain-containing protein [Nanoarchaeota archaeon]MBU1597026.1 helix-turn-helix domain-containing protein [Nanoarchaeota archaeon]MBU2441828.1 helix-turn-helix domain-containing protein [Nanoarchaeota archaeon]
MSEDKRESMKVSAKEKLKLKHFVKELAQHKGRHTELVSVYVPTGYDMNKIINHLQQEQGTASNIKSASTRKNVIDALEKMVQHLKLFKKTPPNGMCVFAGNVAEREGQQDFEVWSIEPPVPMNQRLYRCDKEFVLEPLKEIVEHEETYGMVVLDRRDATIALLKGKTIVPLQKTHSEVPGKMRAGGQCCVPNSLVQLSDGSLPKIEIVHNPHIVKSMVINNHSIRNSNITDKWNVKKSQIYKVITKNPRLELETSKDHKFFVTTEKGIIQKTAEELNSEDLLIMPEKIDVKGNAQKLNSKRYYNSFIITNEGKTYLKEKRVKKGLLQKELSKKIGLTQTAISSYELGKINPKKDELEKLCRELNLNFTGFLKKYTKPYLYKDIKLPEVLSAEFAQFIGYLIGDGCIERDRISFYEQNKEVALELQKKFNKYLQTTSSYKFREGKNYHQVRFTSRPLVRLITEEFPEIKKTKNSDIPRKILLSDNKVLAAFLKGLFDAEGYVHKKRGVAFSVNNKNLAQQAQLVLLRFSILSSLQEYDNRANKYSDNPRFTVDITEKKSLDLFNKYIGFTSCEKNKKLANILSQKTDRSYNRQIIVPGSKIRKLIEKSGYNLQLFPRVSGFFNDKRMMSKEIFMNSILKHVKDPKLYAKLKDIYECPILPVKISKIEKSKKIVEMIDISVKNQNFIANGLFVHNSAPRFARLREGAIKEHYKKIADYMKDQFLFLKDLKGILIGGPSTTTNDFLNKGYLTTDVKNKIIAVKDLSYTGDFGLQELLERSQDVLAEEEVAKEKNLMQKFFNLLSTKPDMASYGKEQVKQCVIMGAAETVLISEALGDDLIDEFDEEAQKLGTNVEVISTETREGVQLKEMGGIAAILRYPVHS